jgi:hypothetical protein
MMSRSVLLGCASALALGAMALTPAFAEGMTDFSGVLSGDYANFSANHGGGSADLWGASGSGVLGLGWSGIAGEIDGGYHSLNFGHGLGNVDDWNVDGTVMWRGVQGRLGPVVGYHSLNSDISGHITYFGGFGEWYAGHMFTLGVKGGGFSATGNTNGMYLGASGSFYVMPDLALTAGYDYNHLNHLANLNTWSAQGEWLVSERLPISVYAGFEQTDVSNGGPTYNTWFAGVRFYTNPTGPAPLVERQREGAATWGTSLGNGFYSAL